MKKLWIRVCSLVLVTVMIIQSLPLSAIASQTDTIPTASTEDYVELDKIEELSPIEPADIKILTEKVEGRTEFSKTFLLDNGLNLAVVYDSAVHFENNGQWDEIDNTLQAKANGTYANKEGVWGVEFPQQLTRNNQITITKDGYTLSFGMAGELRQQGNLEVMSTGSEKPQEELEVPQIAAPEDVYNEKSSTDTVEDNGSSELTVLETISRESSLLQSRSGEGDIPPEAANPEEAIPEATTPEETTPEVTVPEETIPDATIPEETTPEETIPEETTSEVTIPEDTIPEETTPEETVPEETVPEETIPGSTEAVTVVPKQDELQPTATVMIDGATQTFAVTSAQIANGQIQKIDREALIAEADHPETILEKPFSQLMYENVYSNTDIRYDLIGNQVKESVILEAYSSTLRGYQFRLNTGELIPVLAEDGHIDFYDAQQKNIIMVMPAPYLLDANHVFCSDVRVNLSGQDGVYTLTYLLPQQWLAAADRAWPVVLDPVVSADINVLNIRDKTIGSKYTPGFEYEANEMGVGSKHGIQHCYLKYDNLPALTSSDVILKAQISMRYLDSYNGNGTVEVHKVNGIWDSTSLTWSNEPAFNDNVEDYIILDNRTWYSWDITDIARGWYSGENTGMMFKAPDTDEAQTSTNSWMRFYSSDNYAENRPVLELYFRNNNGLESYWDYTTASAGRAGTAYVNQYTGNMTWVHNDIGFGGNRMPVSISHVYNTNDSKSDAYGMGNGWRTNFNQQVDPWTGHSGSYIWQDGDGTAHYFHTLSGKIQDEDGLGLTLKTSGTKYGKYSITDKHGNASYFDTHGRLIKQENNQRIQSTISITYTTDSGKLIKDITDGANRKYNFTYSNNRLSKITYVGSGSAEISSISFAYTSGNLTSIIYKDGKKANFTYGTNNLMTAATDVDDYKLKFTYDTMTAGLPNRIKKFSEHDGSVAGGELNFAYGHNQTILTDHNKNVQVLQFNNWGNTVSIQDGEGRAQYAQFANNDPLTDAQNKGNQLKLSSKMQNTVVNFIQNSNFEKASDWATTSTIVTANTVSSPSYMGNKSVKVTTSATSAGVGIKKTFTVKANETYTFSAYVQTLAASGYLAISQGSTTVTSEVLPKQTGWTRLQVSYTATANGTATISLLTKDKGALYIDCAQFEKAATASRYNLVENSDFSSTGFWTNVTTEQVDSYLADTTDTIIAAPQLDNTRGKLVGNPESTARIHQAIQAKGNAGDVYVVAGWAKAYSVPLTYENNVNRRFSITVNFMSGTNVVSTSTVAFNPCVDEWQYMANAVIAGADYDSMKVQANYDYNANTAYFDGIQLFKEEFGQSFTYDDKGNVTSVTDLQKQKTTYEYENNDLTKEILPTGGEFTYNYDDYHNVIEAITATGVKYTFGYDDFGNNTSVSVTSEGKTIESTAEYRDDDNILIVTTDAAGKPTTYTYNKDTNVLESVKYPNDNQATKTKYTYDSMYRMATATLTTNTDLTLSAAYTYTDDQLTKLQTGSTAYTFNYGNFGLRSSVKIGSRTLASYTYTSQNNYLDTLAYGNGDSVKYTYDQQGRVTKETNENGDTVTYRYDNDGALATVTDSASGITTTYYYDLIDRLMKYVETGSGYNHNVGYTYDTQNHLTKIKETIDGSAYTTSYAYDDDDRVTSVTQGNTKQLYDYDTAGRQSENTVSHGDTTVVTNTFDYREPTDTTATAQIATHTIDTNNYDRSYAYTYDANGNIKTVTFDGKTTTYVYDTARQLRRENNEAAGKTWTYTYDNAGNLLNRNEYAYAPETVGAVLDTVTYTYGNSSWGDLLTEYDGKSISSDTIGNPTKIGNEKSFTWENGREMKTMTLGADLAIVSHPEDFTGVDGAEISFSVDARGEGLTYQWQVSTDGGSTWANSGATGNQTNTISNFVVNSTRDGNQYRCVITDSKGDRLVSEVGEVCKVPLAIAKQPEDFYGAEGTAVSFSVEAEGTGLSYRWQTSGNNGSTWSDSTATGYNTDTISNFTVTETRNGRLYRCIVTDSAGNSITSRAAKLNLAALAITQQPEDFVGIMGDPVTFSLKAKGSGLSYQWQISSNNGSTWNNSTASGNKTKSISGFDITDSRLAFSYRCVITDSAGNSVTSDVVKIQLVKETWTNTYNADGLRTKRTNGNVTYQYVYNGDKLSQMTVGSDTLRFGYSASGTPLYVQWNDSRFFYVTNQQGDVTAIVSVNGIPVVEYTYDAWGNILSITGSRANNLGKLNPLRYRGYVYDREYGLYCLQSRYYNPAVGRFLNADALAATGQGFLGNNPYVYCCNNPIHFSDPSGTYMVHDDPLRGPVWIHLGGNATGVSSASVGGGGGAPIPIVDPSLLDVIDTIDLISDVSDIVNGFGDLSRASEFGIKGYSSLKNDLSGTGLEAHHIVEVRFLKGLDMDTKNTPSVAVTKAEHQKFTNHWRQIYPYGKTNYTEIDPTELWANAQKVYSGYPELLDAVWDTLF